MYDQAFTKITESGEKVNEAKKSWEGAARLYGEDDEYFKTKTSEDFFKNIYTFVETVKKAEKSVQLKNKFN